MNAQNRFFGLALLLQGGAFAVDVLLPATYATGILYVAAMLVAFRMPDRRQVLLLSTLATLCIVVGFVVAAAQHGLGELRAVTGLVLSIGAAWLVAFFAVRHQASLVELHQNERDLQESQRELQLGQAKMRSILETAPEAIITIDERGIVDSLSTAAEKLFGYHAHEVIGRNVKLLMPSPHHERHDDYIDRYLTTSERRIIGIDRMVEGKRKDGTVFPIELAVGEVVSGGRRTFTGFIRDLTTRQRMEQELRQAQKMEAVGQLTGGIAHDFNNLLTVIIGNLEMLEPRVGKDDDRAANWLKEAYETAQLGAELTGRLLAFARRQPLHPRLVDLGELIPRATDLLRRTLGEGVEVRTEIRDLPYRTMIDPNLLENAILNLGINARDAMPRGGVLTVEVANIDVDADYAQQHGEMRPGRYAVISVTDSGAGMSPEVCERAFEPFFTTKPVGAGTGLGLSMVYGFVRQSGGYTQLYSELGHGTTIRLYLPRATEEEASRAEKADSPRRAYPAKGETVLMVEDDARVRLVTVARLKALGYHVLEAENGPLALEILAEQGNRIDLMFTDMVMPGGLSGDELANLARRSWPDLKILFATGYAQPDAMRRGLAESGNWLNKPYTALALARKLREVLDG